MEKSIPAFFDSFAQSAVQGLNPHLTGSKAFPDHVSSQEFCACAKALRDLATLLQDPTDFLSFHILPRCPGHWLSHINNDTAAGEKGPEFQDHKPTQNHRGQQTDACASSLCPNSDFGFPPIPTSDDPKRASTLPARFRFQGGRLLEREILLTMLEKIS